MSLGGYIHLPPPQPPNTNIITYIQARQHLSSVRARLSHTVQDYVSACQLLASTCADDPRSLHPQSHTIALAVDSELSAIEQEVEHMHGVRQVLIDARNRSKMTAPVYSLPVEILTRIFQEATCHDGHDESRQPCRNFSNPVTLSAVCRKWRNAAMGCRPLWAHLDILVGESKHQTYYPSNGIWTHCLKGGSLQMHIRQRDFPLDRGEFFYCGRLDKSEDLDENAIAQVATPKLDGSVESMLEKLVGCLLPLMKHVDSLELITSEEYQDVLELLLASVVDNPKAKVIPVRVLRVIHDEQCERLPVGSWHRLYSSSDENHRYFFSSLTKLDLRNAYTHWDYLRLTNLVELRIESPAEEDGLPVMRAELMSALSSCPKLRSLMLFNVFVLSDGAENQHCRVVLHELTILSLRWMAWFDSPELIFTMIAPGPCPLHMSVHLPESRDDSPEFIIELRSLFDRSNITVLHIEAVTFHTWFASQLGSLPNVHTLALDAFQVSDATANVHRTRADSSSIDSSPVLWPQLRALHLSRCGLERLYFQRLLLQQNVQTLYLHGCFDCTVPNSYDSDANFRFQEECKALVLDHIPNVVTLARGERSEIADWLFVGTFK